MKIYNIIFLITLLMLVGCEAGEVTTVRSNANDSTAQGSVVRSKRVYYTDDLSRSYGVGYGYEGTETYTDYNSVRDLVIDFTKLRQYESENDVDVFSDNLQPTISMKIIDGYDSEQLAKALTASAGIRLDIKVFTGEIKAKYTTDDLKRREYSFCTIYNKCALVSRHCDPLFIRGIATQHPEVLSYGFRDIIDRIKQTTDTDTRYNLIAELIKNYGTFFIYEAELGGRLSYVSTYERKALSSQEALTFKAKMDFCGLVGIQVNNDSEIDYTQTQSCRSYSLTAMGGNVEVCSSILRDFSMDNPEQSAAPSTEIVDRWYKSIAFNADSKERSNVELIDFKLCPIYELIPDSEVRQAVAQQVTHDCQEAYDNLPRVQDRTFACLDFSPKGLFSPYYQVKGTDQQVIMEGCEERFTYRGSQYEVNTLYPVVDGRPKSEGLVYYTRRDGSSVDSLYILQWKPDYTTQTATLTLTPLCPNHGVKAIYYNDGSLGLKAYDEDMEYTVIRSDNQDLIVTEPEYYSNGHKLEISRVGPWYVAEGSQVDRDRASSNYYQRALYDTPKGWGIVGATHPLITGTNNSGQTPSVNPYLWAFRQHVLSHRRLVLFTSTPQGYTIDGVLPSDKSQYQGTQFNVLQGEGDIDAAFSYIACPLLYRKLEFEY